MMTNAQCRRVPVLISPSAVLRKTRARMEFPWLLTSVHLWVRLVSIVNLDSPVIPEFALGNDGRSLAQASALLGGGSGPQAGLAGFAGDSPKERRALPLMLAFVPMHLPVVVSASLRAVEILQRFS
jgi:hypothetical protein